MTTFKKICATILFASSTLSAFAGGLLTNTNQNASFLRQMSQNAIIDITGLYENPAGTAFLDNGWHLSLNWQSAWQTRTIKTTFPLYALNMDNNSTTHEFKGKATAPVIPSFQLSYNHDKWSVHASFALVGGGGKCEFANGLGSFEALYAGNLYQQVPAAVNAQLPSQVAASIVAMGYPQTAAEQIAATGTYSSSLTGYSLNPYMRGRQYYFGLTVGGTYKITDYLAVSAGIRGVYATCNYIGYVQDIKASYAYKIDVPAAGISTTGTGNSDLSSSSLSLNCDQTGIAITPIIGFDCKINDQWNVAMRYEMTTRLSLKNTSEMNDMAKTQAESSESALSQFKDGSKVREDIPGIISVGVQYKPITKIRLNAGMNYYLDKQASKFASKQELIDDNTLEVKAGAEYDINKFITISASWQNTNYSLSDAYMNDLSFNVSSNSIGCGFRINASKRCSIDLGYMKTLYKERTVETQTTAGVKTDVYNRTNDVLGIGVNLNF